MRKVGSYVKIRFLCVRYTCDHGMKAIAHMFEENLVDPSTIPERRCPDCGRLMEMCIDVTTKVGAT
jgi:hypothetical protein